MTSLLVNLTWSVGDLLTSATTLWWSEFGRPLGQDLWAAAWPPLLVAVLVTGSQFLSAYGSRGAMVEILVFVLIVAAVLVGIFSVVAMAILASSLPSTQSSLCS